MKPSFAGLLWLTLAIAAACGEGGGRRPRGDGGDGGQGDGGVGARPISLGAGYNAGLAIDPAGTSYIAWVGPENTTTSLNFCRLGRGAATCEVRGTIAAEGTSLTRPFVKVDGLVVEILSFRYGLTTGAFSAVFLFRSSDGGQTFGAGVKMGTTPFSAAVNGPGAAVSVVTHAYTTGLAYQAIPLGAGVTGAQTEAILSTTHLYSGAVALLDEATPVVVFANLNSDAQVRRYLGTGDHNLETNWSPAQDIGKGDRMHLAGGVHGLFLLAQGPDGLLQVRRYADGTFGAPTSLPDGTGELAHAHMTQDFEGRLHVVWPRIEVTGFHLYYATSDNGINWRHASVTTDVAFSAVQAALAPDRIGVAVWTATDVGMPSVHAIALAPLP